MAWCLKGFALIKNRGASAAPLFDETVDAGDVGDPREYCRTAFQDRSNKFPTLGIIQIFDHDGRKISEYNILDVGEAANA